MTEKCLRCGQTLPPRPTHVYAVKVRVGSGAMKWLVSQPTDRETAQREAIELRATGYEVSVMTVHEAEDEQREHEYRRSRKAARK